MSILIRTDGTQFVIQAYRELIRFKKKSLLIQRIHAIANEQQAQYVRLFKRRADEYETVFAPEVGYLLGESVKLFFSQYSHLIFCEEMQDGQLLLVVIHDGNVFIDTLIAKEHLKNELLPLTALKAQFHIIVFGSVPLTDQEINKTEDMFYFPRENTALFEYLEEPLLPRLPLIEGVKLLPLAMALRSEHLQGQFWLQNGAFILLLIILAVSVIQYRKTNPVHHKEPQKQVQNTTDPYAEYFVALRSPAPDVVLHGLVLLAEKIYQMPGWQATNLTLVNNTFTIKVKSDGGNLHQLRQWANANSFTVELNPDGIYLVTHAQNALRPIRHSIYRLDLLLEALIDNIKNIVSDSNVNIVQTIQHGSSRETQLQIYFQDITPERLFFLKNVFNGLPVVFNNVDFTLNDDSLINGSINFSVWGK